VELDALQGDAVALQGGTQVGAQRAGLLLPQRRQGRMVGAPPYPLIHHQVHLALRMPHQQHFEHAAPMWRKAGRRRWPQGGLG
jgi:hypothetical protein